jgi:ketosteroid isomerase-like protein
MTSNTAIVRGGYERFSATGELDPDIMAPDLVWDMSQFRGWPEAPLYHGVDGARSFLRAWTEGWDDWMIRLESLHDAGDLVVAVVRQSGRSKATGLPVDMMFGMVWTVRDGKQARMTMYADPAEAMRAAGLRTGDR